MIPRAVFDCMIFLQAATCDGGPAFGCFRLVEEDQVVLCLSPAALTEVRGVLGRPKLQKKFASLTPENVQQFLEKAQRKAIFLHAVPVVFTYPRDPKDEPHINLAIAAEARYLVSRDNDLLDLMQDDSFRQQFPNLTILDPVAFLREFAGRQAPAGDLPPGNA